MARLSIHLLGPFQVTLDEEPAVVFPYDHVRALLAYLATESDRPHRRERLAGLLWPGEPHSRALANLRYALYRLRQAIADGDTEPAFLLTSRQSLQFNAASDHWLDVAAFRQRMAAGGHAGQLFAPAPMPERHSPEPARWPNWAGPGSFAPGNAAPKPPEIQNLEAAVRLYRGSFLEGFSLANSAPFDDWQLLRQEQFAQQMLAALHRLVRIHLARGEYEQGEPYARQLLALEPWDEDAHRQLMRLLALSGRRGAALSQYDTCRRLLAEQLGVEPADRTAILHHQIRHGQLGELRSDAPRSALPEPPASMACAPFVAREQEIAMLDHLLHLALASQGRAGFVTGDAGSGKTALIREFARRAVSYTHLRAHET